MSNDGAEQAAPGVTAGAAAGATASPASTETLGGVDIQLLSPLERAAGEGNARATAALLASGTTVPIGDDAAGDRPLRRTVLHWASLSGNVAVISAVLEAVGESGVMAFEVGGGASAAESIELAAQAAAANAEVDALQARCLREVGGEIGIWPLHMAVQGGHVAAVILLLEAGADDTLDDGYWSPPLFLAVELGHEQVALELVRRGSAHIDLQPADYGTALSLAAYCSNLELTKMLVREGATVNTSDVVSDRTPLHFAVNSGPNAADIIDALVAAGADVDAFADHAPWMETPLQTSIMRSSRGVIAMIAARRSAPYGRPGLTLTFETRSLVIPRLRWRW